MKVLIAEDEPLFRKLLVQLLSPDFELVVTEDGDTALARLQEEDGPALAILDWLMPGKSGIDVCREIRARRQTAGIYTILLTARNSAADIVAGLRAGADDYVTKPVQPESFAQEYSLVAGSSSYAPRSRPKREHWRCRLRGKNCCFAAWHSFQKPLQAVTPWKRQAHI